MIPIARADLRRMLRRRGLILTGLLAPTVVALAIVVILAVLHITNPAEHPVAGGEDLLLLASFVTTIAVIFGTVIGAMFGHPLHARGTDAGGRLDHSGHAGKRGRCCSSHAGGVAGEKGRAERHGDSKEKPGP